MSTPIGYPDYQAYPQWRGPTFNNNAVSVTSASPFVITSAIVNYASIYMRAALASGTGVNILFQWYGDAALTQFVDQYNWQLTGLTTEIVTIVPALGNYLKVTISTLNAGTQQLTFTLLPTNVGVPAIRYPTTVQASGALTQNINSNASLVVTHTQLIEGKGFLHVNVSGHATGFNASVSELDQTGTAVATLCRVISTGPPVNQEFQAGHLVTQLAITNTDVAAHNFDYRLSIIGQ